MQVCLLVFTLFLKLIVVKVMDKCQKQFCMTKVSEFRDPLGLRTVWSISLTLLMICLPTITIPSCIHSSIRQPDGSHWQNTEQILTNSSNRESSQNSLKLFKQQIYSDFINIEWISILGVFIRKSINVR